MTVTKISDSSQKLIDLHIPPDKRALTFTRFSQLPSELQLNIAAYISLQDANKTGNRGLIEIAFKSRFYEIQEKPSVYYTCLEALQKTNPGVTEVNITRKCLARVNMALYENSTYLSREEFKLLGIDSAQEILGLCLQKRILMGEMILISKDNALTDLFKRWTQAFGLMRQRGAIIKEIPDLTSPKEIREWIEKNFENLNELPKVVLNLKNLGPLPPEISQIFHTLAPNTRSRIIDKICQQGEVEPFRSLLKLNPSPIVAGMPLPNGLFTNSVISKRFDFAKEAMEHVEFSTLPSSLIIPNEELGEPTDWYQILLEQTAKYKIDAFEFLLNLPNSDRLNHESIFAACLESQHDETLKILSQSRFRDRFSAEQIIRLVIDMCDRLTENKLSSIFQFPKGKEIPLKSIEDLLKKLIYHYIASFACSDTTDILASMQKLIEYFPLLRSIFEKTLQEHLETADLLQDDHLRICHRNLATIL